MSSRGCLLAICLLLVSLRVLATDLPPPFKAGAFPIGVWLQDPRHAARYKALGINLYVGLWKGPTATQLASLKRAGMPVICTQNDVGLTDPNRDMIVGWLQQDEPDNAQPLFGRFGAASLGWGAPISPAEMQDRYQAMRTRDPLRPVLLGLGKGVAWDPWKGRGSRTGHPEDYPEYVKAGDIVAFDIYPAAEIDPELSGRLQVVASGVARLLKWAGPDRPVWATIGASRVKNPEARVDPADIRAQVWMSIISGARGIQYFVHQFKPNFIEATWFSNPELASAIRDINARVQSLASVILGPDTADLLAIRLRDGRGERLADGKMAVMSRRSGCATYLFAASLTDRPLHAEFSLGSQSAISATVLDENRSLALDLDGFSDSFGPYGVHLYVIAARGCAAPGLAPS